MGGSKDPLPSFAPTLLPLPGPHLLQTAGVQLGFVDDLDGNLEVGEGRQGRGGEEVKVPQALGLSKVP